MDKEYQRSLKKVGIDPQNNHSGEKKKQMKKESLGFPIGSLVCSCASV